MRRAVGDSEEESSEFGAEQPESHSRGATGSSVCASILAATPASSAYLLQEGEKTGASETNWKEDNSNSKSWKDSFRLVLCLSVTQAITALPLLSIRAFFLIVSCTGLPSSQ